MPASSQLLKRAIQFAQAGNKQDARVLLRAVTQQEPDNEQAWAWYIDTLTGKRERIAAIQQWLRVSPGSQRARQALNYLKARQGPRQRQAQAKPVSGAADRPQPPAARTLLNYRISLYAALLFVVAVLVCVLGGTAYRDNQRRREYDALVLAYNHLAVDNATLLDQRQAAERDRDRLETDLRALTNQHNALIETYNRLVTDFETLSGKHADLRQRHEALANEFDALQRKSIVPPYIHIHGRTVSIAFIKQDNSNVTWEVPFESLEYDITRGHESRERVGDREFPTIRLDTDAGGSYRVTDHREFVDRSVFAKVMDQLYGQAESDDAFIREVWHVVAQLTSYAGEIQDTPRYPLETLLAGGGDCEDTAILFASMIEAAPVDWKVSLVYMDIDNPTAPVEMNHVIVEVDTGRYQYLVETTSKNDMLPYDSGVAGWYMEID